MTHASLLRLIACFAILVSISTASALIRSMHGNDPIEDHHWPPGTLELANLKSRIEWWEGPPFGGGQYQFLYLGTTADFQTALDTFSRIESPKRILIICQGPGKSPLARPGERDSNRIDWTFTVWTPENWNQLYNNPASTFAADDPNGGFRQPVPPPELQVYIAGSGNVGIDFTQVKVPANVTVQDTRATAAGYKPADASVIRGRLSDMATGKPVAGAEVLLWSNSPSPAHQVGSATADASGHFEITKLAPGTYQVRASARGYAPRHLGYATLTKDSLKEISSALSPAAAISGTATDTQGHPLPGITVRADNLIASDGKGYPAPETRQTTTDAQGRFTIADLPKGNLCFFAYDKSHLLIDSLKRHPVPSENLILQLATTGGIKGKVLGRNGVPPEGSSISVHPEGGAKVGTWSASGRLNPDGTFQFDGVPPGRYTVSANPAASISGAPDPLAQTIEVKPGEVAEVTVESSE